MNIGVNFVIYQPMNAVFFGKSLGEIIFMFKNSAHQIIGDADIKRAVARGG